MANRIRAVDEARRSWHRRRVEIGGELRTHRLLLGATQAQVGQAIELSASEVSRREHGDAPHTSVESLCEHAAAVGLRLFITAHPTGAGVRDAAQLRYIHRFLERIPDAFRRELEAVIPLPGDLRAVDVVLRATGCLIAVEVITRLGDVQAQLRDARLKARDLGATRLVIVVAATHANRRAFDAARPALAGAWDIDTRRVMAALAAGRQPDRDAIVLI
jgi:transcriptional regulator with XRE-family HTH domain